MIRQLQLLPFSEASSAASVSMVVRELSFVFSSSLLEVAFDGDFDIFENISRSRTNSNET